VSDWSGFVRFSETAWRESVIKRSPRSHESVAVRIALGDEATFGARRSNPPSLLFPNASIRSGSTSARSGKQHARAVLVQLRREVSVVIAGVGAGNRRPLDWSVFGPGSSSPRRHRVEESGAGIVPDVGPFCLSSRTRNGLVGSNWSASPAGRRILGGRRRRLRRRDAVVEEIVRLHLVVRRVSSYVPVSVANSSVAEPWERIDRVNQVGDSLLPHWSWS